MNLRRRPRGRETEHIPTHQPGVLAVPIRTNYSAGVAARNQPCWSNRRSQPLAGLVLEEHQAAGHRFVNAVMHCASQDDKARNCGYQLRRENPAAILDLPCSRVSKRFQCSPPCPLDQGGQYSARFNPTLSAYTTLAFMTACSDSHTVEAISFHSGNAASKRTRTSFI